MKFVPVFICFFFVALAVEAGDKRSKARAAECWNCGCSAAQPAAPTKPADPVPAPKSTETVAETCSGGSCSTGTCANGSCSAPMRFSRRGR